MAEDTAGDYGDQWEGKVSHIVESLHRKMARLELKLEAKMELMQRDQEDTLQTLGDKLDKLLALQQGSSRAE